MLLRDTCFIALVTHYIKQIKSYYCEAPSQSRQVNSLLEEQNHARKKLDCFISKQWLSYGTCLFTALQPAAKLSPSKHLVGLSEATDGSLLFSSMGTFQPTSVPLTLPWHVLKENIFLTQSCTGFQRSFQNARKHTAGTRQFPPRANIQDRNQDLMAILSYINCPPKHLILRYQSAKVN